MLSFIIFTIILFDTYEHRAINFYFVILHNYKNNTQIKYEQNFVNNEMQVNSINLM